MTASLTDRLTTIVTEGANAMTDAWRDLGERAFVDTVAALVAGSKDPSVSIIATTIDEQDGRVISLATGCRMSARSAALVDGTSAHALDYDDVDDALIGHPSAVLVPTLMAAGQHHGASGEQLLDAYRVGLEVSREVARAIDITSHYAAGWHSTGTIGAIGAAAAVASLIGVNATQTRHALGIAGSIAAGSRQNFGTMTKALHVGMAASNGLTAAHLARRGFTADEQQIDGPLGFLALHRAPAAKTEPVPAARADDPIGVNVKLYPCCYATHPAIEAAIALTQDLPMGSEITAIEVIATATSLAPLIHHRPLDGTQAKFSMEYVIAAALLDGTVSFASFDPARVLRSDVQELLRKVTVTMSDSPSLASSAPFAATVRLHTATGDVLAARVENAAGHESRPVSEDQLRAKFLDCVQPAEEAVVNAAYDALRHLRDESSVKDVAIAIAALHRKSTDAGA